MYKFKRQDRVCHTDDNGNTHHGYIYDIVIVERPEDGKYYYVQWDKSNRYIYPEDMLVPEPKVK
jgi:hypothetical protein